MLLATAQVNSKRSCPTQFAYKCLWWYYWIDDFKHSMNAMICHVKGSMSNLRLIQLRRGSCGPFCHEVLLRPCWLHRRLGVRSRSCRAAEQGSWGRTWSYHRVSQVLTFGWQNVKFVLECCGLNSHCVFLQTPLLHCINLQYSILYFMIYVYWYIIFIIFYYIINYVYFYIIIISISTNISMTLGMVLGQFQAYGSHISHHIILVFSVFFFLSARPSWNEKIIYIHWCHW